MARGSSSGSGGSRTLLTSVAVALAMVPAVAGHMVPRPATFATHKVTTAAATSGRGLAGVVATVVASPTLLAADGDVVTVVVNCSTPHAADGVVAYSPSTVAPNATAPIDYFIVAQTDAGYLATGTATLYFRAINMRADYVFYLMRNVPTAPSVVAASAPVAFANPNEARAARLIMTDRPDEMRVMWSSAEATPSTRAEWWPADAPAGDDVPRATAPAYTYTYDASDMCGPPATTVGYRDIGAIHTVVMTSLVPGRAYNYTVGDDSSMTTVRRFVVPPAAGTTASLNLVVYGDMGQLPADGSSSQQPFPPAPNTTRRVAAEVDAGWPAAVFHVGDISYAMGYAAIWDIFFAMQDAYALQSRVPYQVVLANHESDFPGGGPAGVGPSYYNGTDSGGECSVPALALYWNPQPSRGQPWYVVTLGPLTAIHLSTEYNFTVGSPQWTFLRDTLDGVDRTVTPWTGVFIHRPMYVDSNGTTPPWGSQPVSQLLVANVEPLFWDDAGALRVDVVVAGHFHDYQRHCAVVNYTCATRSTGPDNVYTAPAAPVHFLVGTAGAPISCCRFPQLPPYTEVVSGTWGYGRLAIHNASHLEWQFVEDTDGAVIDSAWIVRAVPPL